MKLSGFETETLTLPVASEAWRFTQLAKALPEELVAASGSGVAHVVFAGAKVIVNNLPQGIEVVTSDRGNTSDFWPALAGSGPQLKLKVVKTPQEALKIVVSREAKTEQEATLGFLHIEVAPSQKIMIEETLTGNEVGLSAHRTKLDLEADALVEHAIVVKNGQEALQYAHLESTLKERAYLSQTIIVTGGKLTRLQVESTLTGDGAHAALASISKLNGKSHVDLNSTLRHLSANTTASQLAKNLLDDESKAIFTGKVHIAKDCQQVAAEQLNRNLLLSKKAHAIGQPQLEILADDVKCAHGSTTGQIEEDATFYLLSRGINKERAAALLTRAFIEEVIHQAPLPLRDFLGREL